MATYFRKQILDLRVDFRRQMEEGLAAGNATPPDLCYCRFRRGLGEALESRARYLKVEDSPSMTHISEKSRGTFV
jgi:hypothetical protein